MKVAVIGSRTTDLRHRERALYVFRKWFPDATMVVSGNAKGSDQFANYIAMKLELPLLLWLPDWDRYGKRAGHHRNTFIARDCDVCLAFLSHPLAESRGSADTVRKCRELGKQVVVVYAGADGSFYRTAE